MATITYVTTTRNQLRLTVLKTSALGEIVIIDNAVLLAQVPDEAGPLRTALEDTYASADAAKQALQYDNDFRVYVTAMEATTSAFGATWIIDGNGRPRLQVHINGSQNQAFMLVVWEYINSLVR